MEKRENVGTHTYNRQVQEIVAFRTTRQVGPAGPRFEFSRLSKEDEGTYACVARNEAGEAEERVQVIVLEEDELYPEPEEGRYPGGQDRYPGGQDRYPGGQDRYPGGQDRYPGGQDRYPGGQDRYPEGQNPGLAVSGEGQVISEETAVPVGGTIQLECLAVGDAAQLRAYWRRTDGRRMAARHYQQDGILFLVQLEKEDEGDYTCEVVDNRGTVVYEIKKQIILKCEYLVYVALLQILTFLVWIRVSILLFILMWIRIQIYFLFMFTRSFLS
jgi:hypothetical protein